MKKVQKTKLTSAHFRLLRTAKWDYKMILKRDELTRQCKRATPDQWVDFITSSLVIKTIRDEQPKVLHAALINTYYEERRAPGKGMFFDGSRTRRGRQSIENRLIFMRSINTCWNLDKRKLTNGFIRIEMKKAFFPYYMLDST
jgi:hypothetical protein